MSSAENITGGIRARWCLVMIALMVSVAGCTVDRSQDASGAGIITSFNALRLIVEPVSGEVSVTSLLPAGVSPHAYAPRPSETARLHRASLIVHAHPNIDGWIADMTSAPYVALFEGMWAAPFGPEAGHDAAGHREAERGQTERSEAEHRGPHHADGDPHFWTDPAMVMRALPALTDALCTVYPEDCAPVRRQAAVFAGSLATVRDSLAAVASSWQALHPEACFITAQPFMDHFLERFGFSFEGPISPSPDVEASPASLSRLLGRASERGCSILIVQDALENRMEKRLASERGWSVVSVDPLGSSASSYAEYLGQLMRALTDRPSPEGTPSSTP